MSAINPLTAIAVVLATAATDAVYVMFTSAVVARKRVPAATWSSIWYLLSSFAVISYTENWVYVGFAAIGSWIGAYASMTFLHRPPENRRSAPRRSKGAQVYSSRAIIPERTCSSVHPRAVHAHRSSLTASGRFPYWQRRDTSPQREACYLEG